MQLLTTLSLAAALTASVSAQGFVHLDFEKRAAAPDSPLNNRLARRQSSSSIKPIYAPLYQNTNKLEYIINVTIGTPGQNMGVTFDTGSSDLWVPTSQFCARKGAKCDLGYYTPSSSSTYKVLEEGEFNITYAAPGDSDAGDWDTDDVSIAGGTAIQNQIIGAASAGYDQHGVMGFGYDTNEAQPNPSNNGVYKSVLDNMVSQGIINRKAYSVYLNSYNETAGNIIIGGVDSTKYSGPLVALPLQLSDSESTTVREFYVTLTQVAFTDAGGNTSVLTPSGYAQAVLLDTGTSFTSLDAPTIGRLANGLGAVDTGGASYTVPCSYVNSNASVSYTFGGSNGVTVTVPVSELIGQQELGACQLSIEPPTGGSCIFGDTFLRSAYVVLDLDTNVAAIAQAVDGKSGTSSIVAIPSGTTIPGASTTLRVSGTQLSGAAATSTPYVPAASYGKHSSIIAGTPTFNLGAAATSASSSSSSKGAAAPAMTGKPQLAMLGAGLVMGALAL